MKKNAAIGTDKLSEPLILIASAIVMAKQHSVIAKKFRGYQIGEKWNLKINIKL